MQPVSHGWIAAALAVSACASPNPALYTLKPVPGAVQASAHRVIVLRQVGVARYLARSQIVRSGQDYQLVVASNDWWGEPLASMMTRVLIEDLSQRLPNATVAGETSVVSTAPSATLEVEIGRLDGNGANQVVLSGQVAVDPARGLPVARNISFVVAQPTADARGYAAAVSQAVGKVADTAAAMLRR
jgi:hypothetical protein